MNDRLWERSLLLTAFIVALISFGSLWLTWGAAPHALARFSLQAYAPAFAAACASYALRTLRFFYFLRASGIPISFRRTIPVQLVGFALAVTPGRVGEIFKLRLIHERAGTPLAQSAPLLLLDRLTEGGGFLILALASAFVLPRMFDDIPLSQFLIIGIPAIIFFAITRRWWKPVAVQLNARLNRSRWGSRVTMHLENFERGLDTTFTAPQIAGGLALATLARFCDGAVVFFISQMLGANLIFSQAVFTLAVSGLAGGASFLPAGIGAVEATMTGLLIFFRTGLANAIAVVLFTRLSILWFWVVLGLLTAIGMRLPFWRWRVNPDA